MHEVHGIDTLEEGLAERIDHMLHGLCQPLTVLQCRLALGDLNGEPDAMRTAIGEALSECARMNEAVGAMRKMLLEVGSREQ